MRYEITDSHRNFSPQKREALKSFFMDVKQLSEEDAEKQVDFCIWYECEYAVKWFEVIAYVGSVPAGYLRCLRNPKEIGQWYIGDVHVREAYRRRGFAAGMYEKTFKELERYEAAENVISAVRRDNLRSIGLHKKMGFFDTGTPCGFADFYVDENETKYQKILYRDLPLPMDMDPDDAADIMLPIWIKYMKKNGLYRNEKSSRKKLTDLIHRSASEEFSLKTVWCGNRLAGFKYENDPENETGPIVFYDT